MKRLALLAVLAVGLSGCGTILQSSLGGQGPVLYGGTRLDTGLIRNTEEHGPGILLTVASVIDLPLSVALDTLLLPYTLARALQGETDFSVRVGPWPP